MGNKFRLRFDDGTTKTVNAKIKLPTDIIEFVAGTQDPINTKGLKHEANANYWKGTENFLEGVKALKDAYNDLHIESEFYSWSGDNNTKDRNEGAARILDLLLRVYANWKKREIHFHLIGHSHGGNVINQFTELIADNEDFPKSWSIKSITYLSTPFFKEQHQLNHQRLHKDCKIINVYNEYDITQRFVADFTLKNLEYLIENFYDKKDLDDALKNLKEIDFDVYTHLKDIVINNHTEGPAIWSTTHDLLAEAEKIMTVVVCNVAFIGNRNNVSAEKKEFLSILNDLLNLIGIRKNRFLANQQDRTGGYGRSEFLEDFELIPLMRIINRILDITTNESDSYLLGLLDSIFTEEETGLILKIDDTSWSPKEQVDGKFTIEDFNITDLDPYDTRDKKSSFENFATGIENAVIRDDENSLKEILMRMISQFVNPDDLLSIVDIIDNIEWIATGTLDAQLKEARRNLTVYHGLINNYNEDLVATCDIEDPSMIVKPGSIPYLAMTSHGLSHSDLFDDDSHNVKKALTDCFSSGKK